MLSPLRISSCPVDYYVSASQRAVEAVSDLRSGHGFSPLCISSCPVDYYVSASQQAVRSALRTQFLSCFQIVLVVLLMYTTQALNGQLALRSGHGFSPVCILSWPVDYYVSGSQQAVRSALRTQCLSCCQIVLVLVVLLMYTTQALNGQLALR